MTHRTMSEGSYHGASSRSPTPWANALTTELHIAPAQFLLPKAETRNSSMGPPWRIDLMTHHTMSEGSYHRATSRSSTAFVTPVVEHWLEREIAQWVHYEGSIRRPIAPWAKAYHRATSRSSTAFVTPVVEHWLEWEIAQWVHHEGGIRRPIAPWAKALTMELHLAPYPCRE